MSLPSGVITLLFTDIEGSTRLLDALGDRYAAVLAEHRRLLRAAFKGHHGVEVDTQGDAFFVAFSNADDAVAAAAAAQTDLANTPVRIRIGLHTGEPPLTEEGYVGLDVHRAARICAAAHGGQIVLSDRTRAELQTTTTVKDLGLHRLKDLAQSERLFQLGDGDHPPLRSLNASNLPAQASALVGRQLEVAEVVSYLRGHDVRLLTVTGPGGTGKTRLALHAAAELTDGFQDGVHWVPLAGLDDPRLVIPAIEQAIGAKQGLAEHVDEKQLLLLLDNFEQVVEAAADLASVLSQCPNLRLLVTSRSPLHLAAEREYRLLPLPSRDAEALFRERAGLLEPDDAVPELCARLDGLPLAIELAAARTSLLPPSALLRRLDRLLPLLTSGRRDAPDRHKTLYATIAWSYDLLSPDAQRLFARLAVFAGGFELESAETVCAADLDAIGSLADSSLIRLDGERFTMLAAIREYALDRLKEADEEAELRMQHAHYFHEMARKAEPELTGPDQATWLARLDANIDNLRAALVFYREDGRGGILLRMSAALFRFWFVRGYLREGARWLDEALGLTNTTIGVEGRDALAAAAQLAYRLGNIAEAHALNHQALLACQTAADDAGIGRTLNRMADVAEAEGDLDQAERLWRKSIAIARRASDRFGLAVATGNLGSLMLTRGEYDRAIPLVAESMEMHRQLGNVHGQAVALENLGSAASRQGRYDDAVPLLKESLQLFHVLASPVYVASVIDEIAAVLAFQGNAVTATRLLGVTDALLRETGGTLSPDALELRTRLIHVVREQLAEVEYKRAQMDGSRTRTLDEAVEYALAALA